MVAVDKVDQGGFTVILTVWVPVDPSLSVAVRVIVCAPTDRLFVVNEAPVPIWPSVLDVQTRELSAKVPSSVSSPVPLKVIVSPSVCVLPSEGLVMVAVGRVFTARFTVMLTESVPVASSLSVAVRVIVCVSTDRPFVVNEAPVPIWPSMIDVQTRELSSKVPSSASSPVPLKVIVSPSVCVLPSEGLEMVAVGGAELVVAHASSLLSDSFLDASYTETV